MPALFLAVDDETLSNDDIEISVRDHIAHTLAKYKIPKYITIMDALPRNGTGKIVRKSLASYLDMTAPNGGSHE